jgi:hypothetical protein
MRGHPKGGGIKKQLLFAFFVSLHLEAFMMPAAQAGLSQLANSPMSSGFHLHPGGIA